MHQSRTQKWRTRINFMRSWSVEWAYAAYLFHDVNLMMGDANAKVGWKTVHQPTKDKRVQMIGLRLAIKRTYFMHIRIHIQFPR
jgi:hypothetical protein